jgi:hypothetical protein
LGPGRAVLILGPIMVLVVMEFSWEQSLAGRRWPLALRVD